MRKAVLALQPEVDGNFRAILVALDPAANDPLPNPLERRLVHVEVERTSDRARRPWLTKSNPG